MRPARGAVTASCAAFPAGMQQEAASAVGDDRLQMKARGYVVPESFTHGSAAQRLRWFKRGLAAGGMKDCDTFSSGEP